MRAYYAIPRTAFGWLVVLLVAEVISGFCAVGLLVTAPATTPSHPIHAPLRAPASQATPALLASPSPHRVVETRSEIPALLHHVDAQSLEPQAIQRVATAIEARGIEVLDILESPRVDLALKAAVGGALLLRQQPPRADLLRQLESRVVPQLIANAQNAPRLQQRRRSLLALGWIPCDAAREYLLELLRDKPASWEGRLAAEGLSRIADAGMFEKLTALTKGASPKLSLRLRPLLATLSGRLDAVPTPSDDFKLQADFLKTTDPARLRVLAAELLLRDAEFLAQQATQSQRTHQALAACYALQEAGQEGPSSALALAETVTWSSSDPQLRRMALGVVGQQGDPAIPILLDLARRAPDPEDRALALGWLLRNEKPATVAGELVEIARRDPDQLVRDRARRALGK